MCGIAGIIDFNGRKIDAIKVKSMCDAMIHRGPDSEGIYENSIAQEQGVKTSVVLGHRRLSIIDLKTGNQPIFNEDKRICIVYNGEIYNFKELRLDLERCGHKFRTDSDTEVIVHLYEEKGERFVEYLRGMFSFALWDSTNEKLILARDFFGKKPLLYAFLNNRVIFASEFLAILKENTIARDIDLSALDNYLTYLCIPAPKSIYRNIKKVMPAHMVIFEKGKKREVCYWHLDFRKKIKIDMPEAKQELLRLLKEAVSIRLISDVPLGAFLSGGVDSSTIVAIMYLVSSEKIKTFSIGFKESGYNELPYARIVANRFDTDHHEFMVEPDIQDLLPKLVRHFGEPYADSSAIPTYYLSLMASRYVKVALNGDGGDEVFIGYKHHLANLLAEKIKHLPSLIRNNILFAIIKEFTKRANYNSSRGHLYRFLEAVNLPAGKRYKRWVCFYNDEMKQRLYSEWLKKELENIDDNDLIEGLFSNNADLNIIDASLLVDITTNLPNDLLIKMDITSMANSLETRSPLLDKNLMEFVASLPLEIKMRNLQLKHLLKSTVSIIVPADNLYREKRGFAVPIRYWFKNELNKYLIDILLAESSRIRKIFNINYIKELTKIHMEGKRDYSHYLWILLMLELWFQEFES